MLAAKLRQILFGLKSPPVTVRYPLGPLAPEPGYRGRLEVTTENCTGCGGCAEVCPSRCVRITDLDATRRVIRRLLDRCVLCGRCAEACAYEAVRLVADWETATPARADLVIEQEIFMGSCERCGRCYVPAHPLDRLEAPGRRMDEPALVAAGNGHGAGAGAAREPVGAGSGPGVARDGGAANPAGNGGGS